MSHRHRHHARSTSYPESINLSLLSFSRSLSTVPSLSSGSITASLYSVSFPDYVPPGSVTQPEIIPLKDNILPLSPASYFGSPDSLSSNGARPKTRITIAAPTSPRLKQIQEEPACVTKWVDTLPRAACPPGHIPWAGAKVTRELDWVPEGSMFPPNEYSKVISGIRGRVPQRGASHLPTRIPRSPRTHPEPEKPKEDRARVISPRPSGGARTCITFQLSPGNASNTVRSNSNLPTASPRTAKGVGTKARGEKCRPAPIISNATVLPPSTPRASQSSDARTHPPSIQTQPRRKRMSIPTSDMINTLRVQMATLSANTPPPDQTSHNITTSTVDHDTSIPASFPSSGKTHTSSAASPIARPLNTNATANKPYPTENDFGARLSTLYLPTTAITSMSRQPNVAKLASRPTFHPRARPVPRRSRGPTSKLSVSSVSTSYSDEFAFGSRTAKRTPTRTAARQYRTPRTQIFVPKKLPPLSGLPTRHAAYGTRADENKRKPQPAPHWNVREPHSMLAPQLSTHGSLSSIMVSKKPFKEVRFGPLPTSIRRYPPEPSETSEDESSLGIGEVEYYTAPQYIHNSITVHRPLPRSPWVPDLSGKAMDMHSGNSWNFIDACSKYPPLTRGPLSTRHPDSVPVPTAQPKLAASSLKFSSSACNPLLPLIRLPESESTPNMMPSSPSSTTQETPHRKHSFTRRSLSRIMSSSTREKDGSRLRSVGVPTFPSQRSMTDENMARRELDVTTEGEVASVVRSRLPRLRLGNIFSRLKQ